MLPGAPSCSFRRYSESISYRNWRYGLTCNFSRHYQVLSAPVCRAEPDEASIKANSYREKLKQNPAYQRVKQTTWQQNYKPSDAGQQPGPIPEHLLKTKAEVDKASKPAAEGGSITQHRDMAERPQVSDHQQPQASTSGRSTPTPSTNSTLTSPASASEGSRIPAVSPVESRPASSSVRMSRVKFCLQYHAQFGQRMRIVGSHTSLGSWMTSQGCELEWSSGDKWIAIVEIPAGAIVEYKYVLLEGDGLKAIAWQQGNNNVLAVGHSDDNLEVFDTWESGPGAAVVAAGEKTTREGRMLSWANEVEALFASQRNELRRSRMELLAAQEEARLAREEARQFRAELRASQAELAKAEMKIRELTVGNRMLKTQLDDTNSSFRHALEVTHKFLVEAENALTSQSSSAQPSPALQSDDVGKVETSASKQGRNRRRATNPKKGSSKKPQMTGNSMLESTGDANSVGQVSENAHTHSRPDSSPNGNLTAGIDPQLNHKGSQGNGPKMETNGVQPSPSVESSPVN